ncbi:hypothetical protein H6G54_11070 [Anabaena cylindrica FACHB-243]|uniref:Inactive STAND domain-containing protein n=1 Tax=Anabaena cylindrica (strain ATCC 27899 / PCC 7122) TaxID=272123 RepID=K9ZR77_ANACC|nr:MULTISPECIES: hypothetical protein [Anabaena]AFZ61269.1 hypothetical protein Anacy_5986 [Anabaena cylindrica PCC 7122]MBD2418234.1 hypothetical protein [Anabaena cylindrica FACHB-243]MBY5285221.1 hypothetical protein [Anabaena sp. CCAP 1446/1C]MBY5311216.1 hypothetical protein [Anabaena sp. CCAP 1446/1C]MCM2409303.1 hypothetical protein [Anabaena sp. CCAP 1446/1C]
MVSIGRLKNLENRKEDIESQIAELQNLSNKCTQDIKAEPNAARRSQLNTQIDNYSTEIDELYEKLENIEKQINQLKSEEKDLSSNNHLDNPNNQQQSKIDESLRYIDFKRALDTFEKIQSQFNREGDVALFFMEEHLIKRGDLCLQRLRDDLTPNTSTLHRQHFRHCPVTYTSGNLEAVMQGIASFFEVKQEEITPEAVIQKIGNSLQNNSVLFIEIHCDISDSCEIEPLIPWFINDFWQPLRARITGLIEDYDGIKVIAIIISDVLLNPKLSTEQLSLYCDDDHHCFSRNKLIQIPLENWTKDDITNWLIKYGNPGLKRSDRNTIANKIYARTQGLPTAVCYALQQQWGTLTCLPTSC